MVATHNSLSILFFDCNGASEDLHTHIRYSFLLVLNIDICGLKAKLFLQVRSLFDTKLIDPSHAIDHTNTSFCSRFIYIKIVLYRLVKNLVAH